MGRVWRRSGGRSHGLCRSRNLPVFHGTLEDAELAQRPLMQSSCGTRRSTSGPASHTGSGRPPSAKRRTPHCPRSQWRLLRRRDGARCASAGMATQSAADDAGMEQSSHLPVLVRLCSGQSHRAGGVARISANRLPAGYLVAGARRPSQTLGARIEERCCQWLCRAGWHTAASRRLATAPWLDMYFERACVDERRADAAAHDPSLGLIPVYAPVALSQTSICGGGRCEGG